MSGTSSYPTREEGRHLNSLLCARLPRPPVLLSLESETPATCGASAALNVRTLRGAAASGPTARLLARAHLHDLLHNGPLDTRAIEDYCPPSSQPLS